LPVTRRQQGRHKLFRTLGSGLLLVAMLGGCVRSRPAATTAPSEALAAARPTKPILLARARSCPDHPLPGSLVEVLSPELSLITIACSGDWAVTCRCLELNQLASPPDFSRGIVIGLQAKVGERAGDGWPIRIVSFRQCAGIGRIEASFAPGLYYPLETAGYVELAFAPGLRQVNAVCIDKRTFLMSPPEAGSR